MFEKIVQVGFVAKDLYSIIGNYVNLYNIGPWYILKFCSTDKNSMIVYDQKKDVTVNIAVCPIGDVRFEFIEPVTDSIFTDFIDTHSQNIVHHLKIATRDYGQAVNLFKSKKMEVLQSGHLIGGPGKSVYSFLDSHDSLGFASEIVDVSQDFIKPEPDSWFPQKHNKFEPLFIRPSVIGIAVKDIRAKIDNYQGLNIGPWEIHRFGAEHNLGFEAKMAFCRLGNMIIKLVEPESESLFSKHLQKYGESVNHIKMEVSNYDDVLKYLNQKGAKTILSGSYGNGINFSFLDTAKHLNFMVEISNKNIKPSPESEIDIHP